MRHGQPPTDLQCNQNRAHRIPYLQLERASGCGFEIVCCLELIVCGSGIRVYLSRQRYTDSHASDVSARRSALHPQFYMFPIPVASRYTAMGHHSDTMADNPSAEHDTRATPAEGHHAFCSRKTLHESSSHSAANRHIPLPKV